VEKRKRDNLISYGYPDARPHRVSVQLTLEDGFLVVEIEDDGKPFNPLEAPEADTSLPLDQKPIGGLGIHLIRHFMDDLQYRRAADKNILRLRKRLQSAPA
jgi:anti-sigma regulatory factor (Ser/Thr protein kinase)